MKDIKKTIIPLTFLVLFIVFTVLVKTVDLAAVGPLNSVVGFSSLNVAVKNALGESEFFYSLSQILGLFAILAVDVEVIYGLYRLVKQKSLLKVEKPVLALALVYIILFALYIAFDRLSVNFRPVLEDGFLEPSYPSSHTMMILTVFGATYFFAKTVFKKRSLCTLVKIFCAVFMLLGVVSRALSGVHWITDIVGGILISVSLISFYATFCSASQEP